MTPDYRNDDFVYEDEYNDNYTVETVQETIATFGDSTLRMGFSNKTVDDPLTRNLRKLGQKSKILRSSRRFEPDINKKLILLNEQGSSDSDATWQPIAPGIRKKIVSMKEPKYSMRSRRRKPKFNETQGNLEDEQIGGFVFC
eukprot:CAMPEP_0113323434 /NCGR_PEP_ID=MMETSP0010_2-20120614/16302_1 /TAXON_ID=216773 ORGANISM="Corethron hystrix, Strain 308" /NCGR_SAMPLE_ID=MMETSP0010_2 /ASSEMBLY_ACC=CAM_ASM_000155 /LENGTH=141 /DNA_ID=CAMNT_0000182331 /DNA_START=117 /DNA_END=539 /DNA_ORIENTATION=- /assembly_acc=CAM_ASM_000155